MPKVALLNQSGSNVGEIELNDSVFGIEPNQHVLFEAVIMQRASLRQGTHKVKNRSEVVKDLAPAPVKKPHSDKSWTGSKQPTGVIQTADPAGQLDCSFYTLDLYFFGYYFYVSEEKLEIRNNQGLSRFQSPADCR